MKVSDKLNMDFEGLKKNGAINIIALGDSVTHGAFALGEFDYKAVYHNILKEKINKERNYIPVNMINSGIGGDTAVGALERLERDVFSHNPDLVIVCFGLNDVNNSLGDYTYAMEKTLSLCRKNVEETILLTPNMLNTYVSDKTAPDFVDYSKITAEYQNSGRMDLFIDTARAVAKKNDVPICDCYKKWKELYSRGYDTTALLANKINHPNRSMHHLFASELYRMIFKDIKSSFKTESTMYRKNRRGG
mgnify:CR=1 FL=1